MFHIHNGSPELEKVMLNLECVPPIGSMVWLTDERVVQVGTAHFAMDRTAVVFAIDETSRGIPSPWAVAEINQSSER